MPNGAAIVHLDPAIASRVAVGLAWFTELDASEENPFWSEMEALAAAVRLEPRMRERETYELGSRVTGTADDDCANGLRGHGLFSIPSLSCEFFVALSKKAAAQRAPRLCNGK